MPTNLPAEAQAKLAEYQAARDIEEKMRLLQEALGLIPDHKGTEKLRRQLRKRLAELRRESEERRARRVGGVSPYSVEKEGWAQIALIGPANSGKSSLLNRLTGAPALIADYQLSTRLPQKGMMIYEGAEIQVVDLPAVMTESLAETSYASKALSVARTSDLLAIVLDGSKNPLRQLEALVELLEEHGITIRPRRCEVFVEKRDTGGLRLVVMGTIDRSYDEVRRSLLELGLKSAVVKISGEATLEEIEEQVTRELMPKRAVVLINKADVARLGEVEEAARLSERLGIPCLSLSALSGDGVDHARRTLFTQLGLIRVYTQKDGQPSPKPLLIKEGSTVKQLAELIHRELAERMRYARVWGRSVKIQGQRVGPDHVLADMDLVEIRE